MLLKVGYEMAFSFPQPTAIVLMLHVHPSRAAIIRKPERLEVKPWVPVSDYTDSFGNRCDRLVAPSGRVVFRNDAIVEDNGQPNPQVWDALAHRVQDLPNDVLPFLLASRYCEVDSDLKDLAGTLFNDVPVGYSRVQAICNFVHQRVSFDYMKARANRTALETFHERIGVCRDFTHLAITLCRCMNIPARYCTGYLSDIGMPPTSSPMDFSAWFEAYLGAKWHVFDPRNNVPRIGRVLMAYGRDAADVALTTTFGINQLEVFKVWASEVCDEALQDASIHSDAADRTSELGQPV